MYPGSRSASGFTPSVARRAIWTGHCRPRDPRESMSSRKSRSQVRRRPSFSFARPACASIAAFPSGLFAAQARTRSSDARCFSTIRPRRRPAIWPSAFFRVFSSPRRSSTVAIAASGESAASSSRIPIHSA